MDNKIYTSDNGFTLNITETDHPLLTLLDQEENEILRFDNDGKIYIHGKFTENDKQVVDGFREFLNRNSLY